MIEIRHYRAFQALAQELHFGRAARRLGIAQPPLSRCIRDLEERLGARLFERDSRQVRLTSEGFALVPQADELLRAFDRIEGGFRAGKRREAILRVGFLSNYGYLVLPRAIDAIRERRPGARVETREMSASEQVEALRSLAIDVALTSPPVPDDGLVARQLFAEELLVILPRGHRLAGRSALLPEDLAGEEFIVCPQYRRNGFQEVIARVCRAGGFEPVVAHEIDSKPVLAHMIAAGQGVSIVPATSQRFGTEEVVYRALAGAGWSIPCWGVWARENRHPMRREFLEEVAAQGRALEVEGVPMPGQRLPKRTLRVASRDIRRAA